MQKKKVACLLVCAIVCTLTFCASTRAQAVFASVTGRVLDPNAAAIVEATVTAKNVDTGIETTVQTNPEGIYHFAGLGPGNYEFSISKRGFKVIVKPAVTLHVADTISMNFNMQVGDLKETVTVEAGAPMVNTTDASVSTVVDQTYVKNMPLNGRSFQDLILLTPGVVTQSPQPPASGSSGRGLTGEFSVNGQRTESNYYTVDGVSANVGAAAGNGMLVGAGASGSLGASTALGTTQALVSVDALQEFRVQSSTYSAEYGRNPGGQFAFETKSGTNQLHGTAYDYLRNDLFDAADYFTNYFRPINPSLKKTALRQNDFGGTLGGPVRIPRLYNGKDKTFFFVSYEGLRLTAPKAASVSYVPDATLRANAPTPLNQVLNAFPVQSPNGIDDTANGVAQFIGTWSNPSSLNSTSVRFDQEVNDRLRFFFRFGDTGSSSASQGNPPTEYSRFPYTLRTYTAGISSVLSSRLSNQFRLNYSSNSTTPSTVINSFGGSTPVDMGQLTGLGPTNVVQVNLFLSPFISLSSQLRSGTQRQWNVLDTVSHSLGRHQFKFGVDYRRLAPFETQPAVSLFYYYFGASAVKNNSAGTFPIARIPASYPLYTNFSAFAHDEWRVLPRLSFSLGLRWEVNPPPGAAQGLKPYALQGSGPDTWSLAPQGTPLWQTTWGNFAPRFGVAYILRNAPGQETVVRGGAGVFFDTGQQLGSSGLSPAGYGFSANGMFLPGSFPTVPAIPTIVNPPVGQPLGCCVYASEPHLQLPYTLQWNTSIEQALGKSQALTVSYVGSHASRLLEENQFNSSTNPFAGTFYVVRNGLTSDYDALQVQFRRRLTRGLTALAHYTWSHCNDYGSVNFTIGYQRGNCDFDVRHNFSAAFSYELPNAGHNGFANALLHHWGLDDRFIARSSFPVLLNGNPVFDPATGNQTSTGLELVSGQPTYLYGANCNSVYQQLNTAEGNTGITLPCPGSRAINPCAFALPSPPQPYPSSVCPTGNVVGLVPRNFARGFGAWQMNLAVRREFPIRESLRLQFRAEAFNIFNHPNFGSIDSSFGDITFGQATGTLANSLGVLNPLYQTGGSRSMQFALKLVF